MAATLIILMVAASLYSIFQGNWITFKLLSCHPKRGLRPLKHRNLMGSLLEEYGFKAGVESGSSAWHHLWHPLETIKSWTKVIRLESSSSIPGPYFMSFEIYVFIYGTLCLSFQQDTDMLLMSRFSQDVVCRKGCSDVPKVTALPTDKDIYVSSTTNCRETSEHTLPWIPRGHMNIPYHKFLGTSVDKRTSWTMNGFQGTNWHPTVRSVHGILGK